jgi:hypothetical protein
MNRFPFFSLRPVYEMAFPGCRISAFRLPSFVRLYLMIPNQDNSFRLSFFVPMAECRRLYDAKAVPFTVFAHAITVKDPGMFVPAPGQNVRRNNNESE